MNIDNLPADQYFDVMQAATPLFPVLFELETVKANFGYLEGPLKDAAIELGKEKAKKSPDLDKVVSLTSSINMMQGEAMARDMQKLLPSISGDLRGDVYNLLSLIDGASYDEVKKIPGAEVLRRLLLVFKSEGIGSFFTPTEPQEEAKTEPSK